jgi:hypothetical protein
MVGAVEIRRRADEFLKQTISRLRSTPLSTIREWAEYPASTALDLGVPVDLLEKRCVFTLMKDTLTNGDIRVAVQFSRYRFLGMSDMTAEGFIISPDGTLKDLSQQDHWDLT